MYQITLVTAPKSAFADWWWMYP